VKRAAIAIGVVAALGAGAYAFVTREHVRTGETVATYTAKKEQFVRRVTAEGNLQSVKATPILTPQNSAAGPMKIAWLAPDGSAVKSGDIVVKFDPSDSERRLRDGKADLDSANARLAQENVKSQNAVDDSATDADLAGDELEQTRRFQAKDAEIFSRNQIIESEVDANLAGEKQTHAQQAQVIEKKRSQSNAAVIVVDKAKAQLAIDHANKALASMQVGAPNDGVFVLERNWRGQPRKVGDQMMPGQAVAEIPLLSSMEAEVYVLEIDGSGLTEKQSADVVIEARPGTNYHGTIKLVDKLAQPRQNGSPVQYFGVTITLDKTDPAAMKPGQRVQATLVLDQEDAIVVPRQTVFTKEATSIVYRKTATGFEPVTVELGAATAGRVVIKKGLSDGDEIALRDPTTKLDDAGSNGGSAK
jgi:HlyD family secretion protein